MIPTLEKKVYKNRKCDLCYRARFFTNLSLLHKLEKIKQDAQDLAAKLEGVTLSIGAKTSSTGTIFGSVTNIQIAEALEKKGYSVDRKVIIIKEAVKEVGSYKALLKLHKEVSVEIPFEVVSE